MRRIRSISIPLVAAAALMTAVPALAQTKPAETTATQVAIPRGVFFRGQAENQVLSSDNLIGAKIYGPDDKIIAGIEDLILSSDLKVEGVVVGTGGFLGAGGKQVGVRLSALRFGPEGKVTIPELTKEVIAALPAYERRKPAKTLLERATAKAREITDRSMETAKPTIDHASEAAKEAYDKAKEATKDAYGKAKEAIEKK